MINFWRRVVRFLIEGPVLSFGGGQKVPKKSKAVDRAIDMQTRIMDDQYKFTKEFYEDEWKPRVERMDQMASELVQEYRQNADIYNQFAEGYQLDDALFRAIGDQYAGFSDQYRGAAETLDRDAQWFRDNADVHGQDAQWFRRNADDYGDYTDTFNQVSDAYDALSADQYGLYRDKFRPVEERLADDAMNYDSPGQLEHVAGRASADVAAQFSRQKQDVADTLARYGINPNSGRFAEINAQLAVQQAAAQAGAANTARENRIQGGIGLRQQAANYGQAVTGRGLQYQNVAQGSRQLAEESMGRAEGAMGQAGAATQRQEGARALAGQATGLSNNARQLAENSLQRKENAIVRGQTSRQLAEDSIGRSMDASRAAVGVRGVADDYALQGANLMNQGLAGTSASASALGNLGMAKSNYNMNRALNQYGIDASESAGYGKFLGMNLGMGMDAYSATLNGMGGMMSSKEVKTRKYGLKDEKVLNAVKDLEVDRWEYKPGVADEGEHIGPYAEDFQKLFGVGDGRTINVVDAIGVNLAAVKGLANKVDRLEKRLGLRKPGEKRA